MSCISAFKALVRIDSRSLCSFSFALSLLAFSFSLNCVICFSYFSFMAAFALIRSVSVAPCEANSAIVLSISNLRDSLSACMLLIPAFAAWDSSDTILLATLVALAIAALVASSCAFAAFFSAGVSSFNLSVYSLSFSIRRARRATSSLPIFTPMNSAVFKAVIAFST